MSLREPTFVSFKPDGPTKKQIEAFTNTPSRLEPWGKFLDFLFGKKGKPHRR